MADTGLHEALSVVYAPNALNDMLQGKVVTCSLRCVFVSWCFEASQQQRITSGLNTNFTLSPSYSFHKSSYHKSCFLSLFIFRGHSTREPASSRVTYFILQAYTGTFVSHNQHRKNQEKSGKNAGEWTGRIEIRKEEIPGSKRSMCGYILTYSRL